MDFTRAFNGSNGMPPGNGSGGIGNFDNAEPAPDFAPIPPGVYVGRVLRGEYATTRAGADGYRLRFEVTEGAHAGKTLIRTWTFGPKAIAYTRRDLLVFGLTTTEQLLSPFPDGGREYRVRLVVAVQCADGIERNDIKRIDLIGVTDGPAAGFELPDDASEGGTPA